MEPDLRNLQQKAYNALNDFFAAHEDDVVEIEMLPSAIQPTNGLLMQDGLNLGVPKKVLVAAYVRARQLFFEGIKAGTASLQALEASRVVLLFDPEHITVANFRKRRILDIKGSDEGGLTFDKTAWKEMVFLNSILTSPLHRQSKSPTLWHHRAWLLELLIPMTLVNPSRGDLLPFLAVEIDAVLKAGERHPKNYYAFQYARRLLARVEYFQDETSLSWKNYYTTYLHTRARLVKIWCCKHPSDISGWSFLLFLLPRLEIASRKLIVQQVLEYAINLKVQQMSVWIFLRTALAESFIGKERDVLVQQLYKFKQERATAIGNDWSNDYVVQAEQWIKSYSKALPEMTHAEMLNAG